MNLETVFTDAIKVDMNSIIAESVEVCSDEIVQLNKSQLSLGEDSAGESLGEYANFSYKNRWKPVDLLLTGDFWRRLTVVVRPDNESFEIVGFDEKTADLQQRYGEKIIGISKELLPEIPSIIKTEMQEIFRREVTNKTL